MLAMHPAASSVISKLMRWALLAAPACSTDVGARCSNRLSLWSVQCCRNKLVQITYALANVYDDTPDLEVRVTEDHRQLAADMMGCVESGDVTRLRECFMEVSWMQVTCRASNMQGWYKAMQRG